MKFLRVVARIMNIVILSLFFLIATTFALSPSAGYSFSPDSEGVVGVMGYVNLSNILFYTGYILFGVALLQYVRNKNVDWHNFYLALILTVFCWIFLLVMVHSPFFDQFFSEEGNPQLIQAEFIEFVIDAMNEMEKSETIPDHFYDYFLNFIISYNLAVVSAIFLFIPITIYGAWLLIKRYVNSAQKKIWFTVSWILTALFGIGVVLSTFFGEMTTGVLAIFRKRDPKAWETDHSFQEKIDNMLFAKAQAFEFFSQLYIDPIAILFLLGVFLLLIVSIASKKLNTNTSKLLIDEYN